MTPIQVLKASSFGKRTAEEEREELRTYFVETEQWSSVFSGEVDVVYGPKGSGKSAIYSLITQNDGALFDRNIIIAPGENPQGAPAFRDLAKDPPRTEFEFVSLWKLYILTLCGRAMQEYDLRGEKCAEVIAQLQTADLIPSTFTLSKALTYAFDYVKSLVRIETVEGGVVSDPTTGMPVGVSGKISFREPSAASAKKGVISIDELFSTANEALRENNLSLWVLLDRLDVAFAENTELETQALRALFKFYLDTKSHKNISTKIFLRSDIWSNISSDGFREASHIERSLHLQWKSEDLLNLLVRRLLSNDSVCKFYEIDRSTVLSDFDSQRNFFYSVFPDQVESGRNKPDTFGWLLGRTSDASQLNAPRELIHFLNELRATQIGRLERGERPPSDNRLFEQITFKETLPAISKTRLEQTLYAEYPKLRPYIESLNEQKATQDIRSLQARWQLEEADATRVATELEKIGFFEKRRSGAEYVWRVPFLYRPALNLVQGSSDG